MHTYKGKQGTTIHHNGGVAGGHLLINVPRSRLEETPGEDNVQVSLVADDIIDFVLDRYLSRSLIGLLEQVSWRDLLAQLERRQKR